MGKNNYVIYIVIFLMGLLPLFSAVTADENITVNIHLLGETTRTRFGSPVIVAGVWHYINITLQNQVPQTLTNTSLTYFFYRKV